MRQSDDTPTPVPGILATLAAGFDLVTKNPWVLLPPLLLDIFLWLGPRLSFTELIVETAASLQETPELAQMLDPLTLEALGATNLLAVLSVPLIGLPTLMTGLSPAQTPLPVAVNSVGSYLELVTLFVGLTIVGLGLTAVFFNLLSSAVTDQEVNSAAVGSIMRLWLKLIGLALLFLLLMLAIYMMLLPVLLIMALFSSTLVLAGGFLQLMLMTWALLYWFYVPYGLALNGRTLAQAVVESLQMMRRFLLPTVGLILATLLVRQVMGTLMVLADDGSWLTAVSLVAHAFVSTALVAAAFIFYRDRYRLLYDPATTAQPLADSSQRTNQIHKTGK